MYYYKMAGLYFIYIVNWPLILAKVIQGRGINSVHYWEVSPNMVSQLVKDLCCFKDCWDANEQGSIVNRSSTNVDNWIVEWPITANNNQGYYLFNNRYFPTIVSDSMKSTFSPDSYQLSVELSFPLLHLGMHE